MTSAEVQQTVECARAQARPGRQQTALRRSIREPMCFYGVLAAAIVTTFRFRHFPSWDGLAHVGSAAAFVDYGGAASRVFVRDFFPLPGLVAHALSAVLLNVWSAAAVNRITAALCAVAVATAARSFVRRVAPTHGATFSYLPLCLAVGWFVHAGQYGFLLGSAMAFWHLGRLVSHRRAGVRISGPVEAVTLLAIYAGHLVPFAFTLLVTGLWAIDEGRSVVRRRVGMVVKRLLPAVPAALLLAAYTAVRSSGGAARRPIGELLVDTVSLRGVAVAFGSRAEAPVLLLLAAAVGLLALRVAGRWSALQADPAVRPLVWACIAALVLYWVVPSNLGGGSFLSARLLFFALIVLTGLAATGRNGRSGAAVTVLAVLALAAAGWSRADEYRNFSKDLAELSTVSRTLSHDDVVLTLMMCEEREPDCASATATANRPLAEASGMFMADAGAADLSLYEGYFPYFPLKFTDRTSPAVAVTSPGEDLFAAPPAVDLGRYERASGIDIDVVVLWGRAQMSQDAASLPRTRSLLAQLADGYRLVLRTEGGHVEVYRRVASSSG